jgi:hypothetical protein
MSTNSIKTKYKLTKINVFQEKDEKNVGTLENNRYRRLLKLMNNELRESKVDSLP